MQNKGGGGTKVEDGKGDRTRTTYTQTHTHTYKCICSHTITPYHSSSPPLAISRPPRHHKQNARKYEKYTKCKIRVGVGLRSRTGKGVGQELRTHRHMHIRIHTYAHTQSHPTTRPRHPSPYLALPATTNKMPENMRNIQNAK